VGVLRLSGPQAADIGRAIAGSLPAPRRAQLAPFKDADGSILDVGLILNFPGPQSFTGEDVVELQGHGGPVVLESLVERAAQLGARRARPGEFSERAFLNDKIDLAQAEAISDLIDAGSKQAARAALRSLQGEFSERVHQATDALTRLRVYVEAAIDFPEEEIDFLSSAELTQHLAMAHERLAAAEGAAKQGRLLSQGMHVVIAGRPNAGKSTLLNRLAGYDAAIVTEQPGTTRDLLRERIDLDGLPLHLVDTAGLRADTGDAIEQEGIRRARAEMTRADRVLFLVDGAVDPRGESFDAERDALPAGVPVTCVFNKCDLAGQTPGPGDAADTLWICAASGAGVDALRSHLKSAMGYVEDAAGAVSARGRHLDALARARTAFDRADALLARRQGELVAEELRYAQDALGEITGVVSSDALLGRIFSSFCIGK
jgi:tRNA modification GTPase